MNTKSGINISVLHSFCTYTYNLSIKERQKIEFKKTGDFKKIRRKRGQSLKTVKLDIEP